MLIYAKSSISREPLSVERYLTPHFVQHTHSSKIHQKIIENYANSQKNSISRELLIVERCMNPHFIQMFLLVFIGLKRVEGTQF